MRIAIGLLVTLAVWSTSAVADSITYEVGPFSAPGFGASSIHYAHGAGTTHPDNGVTYYMSGASVWSLSGTIEAERNLGTGHIDFTGGTLVGDSLGLAGTLFGVYDVSEDITVHITGGFFDVVGPDGRPGGFLVTSWEQSGAPTRPVYFYFAPLHFSGPANSFLDPDLTEFTVWGNNTFRRSGIPAANARRRVGIDLYAKANPTPEPGTYILVGSIVAFAAYRMRKKKAQAR